LMPAGNDERVADLKQGFLEHLLRGRLEELFLHASDLEHWQLLVRVRGRQFLSNVARKGNFENLWKRARETLEDGKDRGVLEAAGTGATRRWWRPGRPGEPFN